MKRLAAMIGAALLLSCVVNGYAQTANRPHDEGGTRTITMWDACDPDSFNAAVRPTPAFPATTAERCSAILSRNSRLTRSPARGDLIP